MSKRVLIHTDEILGEKMAGPGIRAWRMAEVLSGENEVTVYTSVPTSAAHPAFQVLDSSRASLDDLTGEFEIVIHQGGLTRGSAPSMYEPESEVVVIADFYGAWVLEQQEQRRSLGRQGDPDSETAAVEQLSAGLQRADHVLCASERQRELWIGYLMALGRVRAEAYDADPAFADMVTVVPFGLDGVIDPGTVRRVKGVVPGIASTDKVALWGGGIHDWFDPLTLIRAMARLAPRHPDARLLFLGTKHPNPNSPAMKMVTTARDLASSLGVEGSSVIFNEGWVPLEERGGYFIDADVGVSIHHLSLETEFSFRTRMLDFLWGGLPIVATTGDVFADTIEERGLGAVVGDNDVEALEAALERFLFDETAAGDARRRVAETAQDFTWTTTLEPLVSLVARATTTPGRLAQARLRAERTAQAGVTAAETARLAAEVARLAEERDAALHAVNAAKRELDEFRGSTSWRVTAPLRKVTRRRR